MEVYEKIFVLCMIFILFYQFVVNIDIDLNDLHNTFNMWWTHNLP